MPFSARRNTRPARRTLQAALIGSVAAGTAFAEAVVDAGASVILADPIFKGLAIALMAGEIASLLISRMAVPVLYFMAKKKAGPSPRNPVASESSKAAPISP